MKNAKNSKITINAYTRISLCHQQPLCYNAYQQDPRLQVDPCSNFEQNIKIFSTTKRSVITMIVYWTQYELNVGKCFDQRPNSKEFFLFALSEDTWYLFSEIKIQLGPLDNMYEKTRFVKSACNGIFFFNAARIICTVAQWAFLTLFLRILIILLSHWSNNP